MFRLAVWLDNCLLSLQAKGKQKSELVQLLTLGIIEKDEMGNRGWRSECRNNWHKGEKTWKKKKAEDALVALFSIKYITVPLSLYAFWAHIPGEGLHFTKEVMQTYLHLVTMDMALQESKPTICIANNQEEWRTHSMIFWQETLPGSSLWLITSKTITSFGSVFAMKRKKGKGLYFRWRRKRQNHSHLQNNWYFLYYPVWNTWQIRMTTIQLSVCFPVGYQS